MKPLIFWQQRSLAI